MAILEIKNLVKRFDKTEVLKDVSFSMEPGEVVSVIGSSGSGKTTLLRCINFLEKADKGQIILNGEVIFDGVKLQSLSRKERKEFTKRAQIIFQDPYSSLNPRMFKTE